MSNYTKLAAAVAAVLVVGVVGYQFIPGFGSAGRSASPTSTAVPSPTAVQPLPASGPLDAGTYRMGNGPSFLVTVPSGWVAHGEMSVRKNLDEPNELAFLAYPAAIRVFADACESAGTEEAVGPTTQDLITALLAQENSEISEPVDVTIGGLPGKRFEVSAPAGLDLDQCSIRSLQIWADADDTNFLAGVGLEDTVASAYAVDTHAGRLIFVPQHWEATPADIAELEAVVASIEIVE